MSTDGNTTIITFIIGFNITTLQVHILTKIIHSLKEAPLPVANEGSGGGDATGDLEDDLDISDSDSDHRYAHFNANCHSAFTR